ncbi:MAG: ATP synthase subunit I [Lachnospiraceae bacterium]
MSQVRKTLNGFFLGIGIYTGVMLLIGLFIFHDRLSYGLGLLFGSVVAVLVMIHIVHTLDKALDMPEQQAVKYTRRQAFLRLGMMLIALIVALSVPWFHFVAVVIGMLGLKIGSFLASFLLKKMYPDEFVTKSDEET